MVEDIYTVSFTAMGSRCEVRIAAADAAAARNIATQAIDEVRRITVRTREYLRERFEGEYEFLDDLFDYDE